MLQLDEHGLDLPVNTRNSTCWRISVASWSSTQMAKHNWNDCHSKATVAAHIKNIDDMGFVKGLIAAKSPSIRLRPSANPEDLVTFRISGNFRFANQPGAIAVTSHKPAPQY